MALAPVLIVVTAAAGDAPHLSLAPAASLEDCQAKAEVVGQILEGAGAEVLALRCGETALAVTPYAHDAAPGDFVHNWRVELEGETARIAPLAAGEACAAAEGVVCAVSAQTVAE